MSVWHAKRFITVLIGVTAVAGCAGESLWLNIVALNPAVQRKWQEDELYGPTYYSRRDELRALRDAASQIPPEQKGALVQKLTDLIRDDPNALIRREAVLTAGYEDSPDIVPALRLAISDADPDVRSAACIAWRRHGGSDAEEVLAAVARDDTELDVRMAAVTELQHFRGPNALAALAKALDDPDPALQYRAVLTLREVSDTDYGYNVYAWRDYLRGNNPPVPQAPSFVERVKRWF